MNRFSNIFFSISVFLSIQTFAQTAPYSLSPKWVFGENGYLDFTSGSPVQQTLTDNDVVGNEGGSTLCDSNKNVVAFTNSVQIAGADFMPNATAMTSARSATQGGILIPNPSDPYGKFFIITGNSEVALSGPVTETAYAGIRLYSSNIDGSSVTAPSEVSVLATDAAGYKENVSVSLDADWGYHIISGHAPLAMGTNTYSSWHLNKNGILPNGNTPTTSTGGTQWNSHYQGTIKVNRCQDKIAFVNGNVLEVKHWNRTTGTVGNTIFYSSASPGSKYYGCEFSPNGNYLFATTMSASPLIRVDLINGILSTIPLSSAVGTLQLGPDNIIYVSNGDDIGSSVIGTIANSDLASPTYTANSITLTNAEHFLGLANIAWLHPRKPKISYYHTNCVHAFIPEFLTYFKDPVSCDQATWDFGDGSEDVVLSGSAATNLVEHTFAANGNYVVTLSLRDAVCGHIFTTTIDVHVSCSVTAMHNSTSIDEYIRIAPNPTASNFNVEIMNSSTGFIRLYSLTGEEVFSTETTTSIRTISFGQELPKGLYILKYANQSGNKSYKLEKQ